MTDHNVHPLTAAGTALSGFGALVQQYAPTVIGFALTLVGLWLQRREHQRHEAAMAAIRRPK